MTQAPNKETAPATLQVHTALSPDLQALRREFGAKNFTIDEVGDPEWEAEIKEWFWKEPDIFVFAYWGSELAGIASLTVREVDFGGETLKIAGLGGLTVSQEHRGRGIAKQLIVKRLELAREKGADIAFLNTDISKLGKLFAEYGFEAMRQNYSFVGKSGKIHEDDSGMIAPVLSPDKFAKVMASDEVLFIGESNI